MRTPIQEYILSCIDSTAYDIETETEKEKLQFMLDTFGKEKFGQILYYKTVEKMFISWMQGLPSTFNVDYENYRILELAYLFELIPANADDNQESDILENWWKVIFKEVRTLLHENDLSFTTVKA
jgi:hypothetical protein